MQSKVPKYDDFLLEKKELVFDIDAYRDLSKHNQSTFVLNFLEENGVKNIHFDGWSNKPSKNTLWFYLASGAKIKPKIKNSLEQGGFSISFETNEGDDYLVLER